MKEYFVSLVGTQVFGTLQPWLAHFMATGPGRAFLLYTDKTRDYAERLKHYAESRNMGEVTLIKVPYGLDEPGNAATQVCAIAEEASKEGARICFNLDGGMNYMINACVLALDAFSPVLTLASLARIVRHDLASGKSESIPAPLPLTAEEIMEIQGVAYSIASGESPILNFCKERGIKLPDHAMKRVTVDGITFDLVWNSGNNRLSFLKDFPFRAQIDNKVRLAEERDLAQWATDRNRSGQLYDKVCHVTVASAVSEEHLRNESGGKLDVVNIRKNGSPVLDLENILKKWFGRNMRSESGASIAAPSKKSRIRELDDGTLVVCMGKNLMATLAAICAHHPRRLVLCHTEKEKQVRGLAERLARNAAELGIEEVDLVNYPIDGSFADLYLPPAQPGAKVHVNITPGGKGQGAMLGLWGKRRGYSVWSLDNESKCVPIHNPYDEASLPVTLCDPKLFYSINGETLLSEGISGEELKADPMLESMLDFMRKADDSGKVTGYFVPDIKIGSDSLTKVECSKWRLANNGKEYLIDLEGGEWFERLAGYSLLCAGADHVRTRVRMPWPQDMPKRKVDTADSKEAHRLDLDVVGVFGGNFVLVSCKSNPFEDSVEKTAIEAQNTGQNMGRFCLRMLAHMRTPKARTFNEKVMIFGWRELCHPEKLAGLVNELAATQRTIREVRE